MHHRWKRVQEQLLRFFERTTVADIGSGGETGPAAAMR
jgi:hypothetical protein